MRRKTCDTSINIKTGPSFGGIPPSWRRSLNGAALRYDKSRGIVWTVGPDRKFNGEKIPGKDSYGRNSGYVVNIDGSPQGTQKAERK